MKVYIVVVYTWESGEVEQVCSTYERARQFILDKYDFDVDNPQYPDEGLENYDPAFIEEWEVT